MKLKHIHRTKFITLLTILTLLQGCIPVIVGAAVGGGFAAYNRKSLANYASDSSISFHAAQALRKAPSLKHGTHIVVETKNRNVLMLGQVPTPAQRIEAYQIVKSIRGVRKIYNEISIAGPATTLTRTSDSMLTSQVKSKLMLAKHVPAGRIKVVTENGVVYLMGKLTETQSERASAIARKIDGVQRVVTLFDHYG